MDGLLVDKSPIIFADRLIVRVILPNNTLIGFYRSTGRNSCMPGRFLPFDGCLGGIGYFLKSRFSGKGDYTLDRFGISNVPIEFHRIGSRGLDDISKLLAKINFKSPMLVETPEQVNQYLFGRNEENRDKLCPIIWDY